MLLMIDHQRPGHAWFDMVKRSSPSHWLLCAAS